MFTRNMMLTRCISKSIRVSFEFVGKHQNKTKHKTVSIFCRYNYLGFHITYEKSPIICMRVCVFVCVARSRCERNISSRWHIQLNSSQLRHNTKIVNKLNEFKDVARLAAYVSIAWVLAKQNASKHFPFLSLSLFLCMYVMRSYHMSGEHWACNTR